MGDPLVSVCMACHNAGKYVAEALDSVLVQSYPNIEIIVVNDGSVDDSAVVLERYQEKGVRVIHQQNRGHAAALNEAYARSSGEFIKFFDADDILSPDFIRAQVERLNGRTDDVASAKWGRFYSDDLGTFRLSPEPNWKDMESTDWLVESYIGCRGLMQCALFLIPRPLLQRAGGWDESLSLIDDFEFFTRLLCASREVLFCPGATLYYRSGMQGSLSMQRSRQARESECEAMLTGTSHLLAKRNDPRARLACANVCQHTIYDVYPNHPDLLERMQKRVDECGGAEIAPSGGRYFHALRPFIGWKLARRLQRAVGR